MMSQFAAGKNPPWARPTEFINVAATTSMPPPNLGQPPVMPHQQGHTQTVYSVASTGPGLQQTQFATAQQLAAVAMQQAQQGQLPHSTGVIPQPGIAIPTSLGSSSVPPVSYPNIRTNQQHQHQHQQQHPKQRVFTGTITKLHENFGFVDEDVFFQKSCVKGTVPKVGERVLVEATYNPTMPFKWNATRIQVLPNQPSGPIPLPGMKGVMTTHVPPPGPQPIGLPGLMGPGSVGGLRGNIGRRGDSMRYDRDKERERDRDRERERRERMRMVRKRSRSPPGRRPSPPNRPRSPPRRRPARIAPRYVVQIPKLSFDLRDANVVTLKSRYTNMYIPSDFFSTKITWPDAFPHVRPIELGQHCNFHVMHKDVEPLSSDVHQPEPADVDHKYSAKVMLFACPTLDDLYHSSCSLAEDTSDVRENFQHPTRLLHFLVGLRGKGEPMSIGGAWSPSLDGPNPEEDPRVLINTAIRTTKSLTGIDLSKCIKWYRFTEIRYLRAEETHKGRVTPARVETVVIFLPDVWSCCPTQLEWEGLQAAYKKHLQSKLSTDETPEAASQEEPEEAEAETEQNEPTHFSDLEPRSMKLVDLRRELESRSMSSRGLRSQLIARLNKAMKAEQEQEKEEEDNETAEEENVSDNVAATEEAMREEAAKPEETKDPEKLSKEEEEKKRKDEREKAIQERRYMLPDNPSIIVNPSPTAKGGKFDCTVMSLSLLLDYRPEDNKEHSFEVSLFAELFNEMLMRDLGYCIYKALAAAPEKKEEEKKEKKKADSKEKDSASKDSKDAGLKDTKDVKETSGKDSPGKDGKSGKDGTGKDSDEKEVPEKDPAQEPSKKKPKLEESEKKDKSKEKKDDKSKSKSKDLEVDEGVVGVIDEDKEEEEESTAGGGGGVGDPEDMEDDGSEEEGEKDTEETEDKKPDPKKLKEQKISKDRVKKRSKRVTVDRRLLLAFVYFDQNHTAYLLDKDIEEILHTTGLRLSRAQARKLSQKLSVRDGIIHYRKLTDLEEAKKEEAESLTDGTVYDGNLSLLIPSKPQSAVDNSESDVSSAVGEPPSTSPSQSGMISYKGAMLDVQSILQQLEKSEKTRAQMETRCMGATKEISELKNKFVKTEEKKETAEDSVEKLQSKLDEKSAETALLKVQNDRLRRLLHKTKDMFKSLEDELQEAETQETVIPVKKEKANQ